MLECQCSEMLIRQACVNDSAAIAAVGCRSWVSAFSRFERQANEPGVSERTERVFRAFADEFHPRILLAETAGVVLGWGARDTDADYISDLWIDPAFHRRGIGRALMDALMAGIVLKGYARASIETHARNLPAIRLYERCGFEVVWRGQGWSDSLGREIEKVRMEAPLDERFR